MIHALLDALRRQQMEQYEKQKIYELDYRNPAVKDSDVLLVNLAAEYLGIQKTVELALACHAKIVSLILWDPDNFHTIPDEGYRDSACRAIPLEQAVVEFQARDMDLVYLWQGGLLGLLMVYMRDPQDENGNRLIRLDFQCVYA